ncbi:hypothetical protein AA313_de0207555 [Arthrobotrys entomopaga]|nr:hypothetical protein AA313_de0207555 [Arthrobotrys entomopaga]
MRARVAFFFQLVAFATHVNRLHAQSAQCVTVANGCDSGSSFQAGISSAIARFQDGFIYGGDDDNPIVMSSALQGSNLAMITYTCSDGSTPPQLEGSAIRSSLQKVLSCPNQCGGVASSTSDDNCGFGVLVASGAADIDCFSKSVNVVPEGAAPSWVPSVGSYSDPVCLFDSPDARVLNAGSVSADDMTVEKCADLAAADGYMYFGVEFGIECYWGDAQTNPSQSAQDNCNQACAGNIAEVCGAGNRILLYTNSNSDSINKAKISVDNYNLNPTSALAHSAWSAISFALNDAFSFLTQLSNPIVITAQEQLIQDLTEASTLAAAAASAAAAAALADAIAKAIASEQAVQDAKNQKPTETITQGPTSTPATSTTSTTTTSTTSTCPLCVSCADDANPETGDEDGQVVVFDDDSDFDPDDGPPPPETTVDAKRDLHNEEMNRLIKRGSSIKTVEVCNSIYKSNTYSSGTNKNRYDCYGYSYTVNTAAQCVWKFNFLTWTGGLGGSPPKTQSRSYDAEHVYEAQLVAQFARHIGEMDTGKPCRSAGLIKNYLARQTRFPGRSSNVFSANGGSALAEMVKNLPSDTSGLGGVTEMVALDKELNILKAAVFDGDVQNFSTYLQANGNLARATRFAMLRQYLTTPAIVNIFKATSRRMRATLAKLDIEIANSTIDDPGIIFADEYAEWEDDFLFARSTQADLAMDSLITLAITTLETNVNIGTKQLRLKFANQVRQKTAPGTQAYPPDWLTLDDTLRV